MTPLTLPARPRSGTRVIGLVVHRVRIPLRTTIRHASHARTYSDNLIVACELADGVVGYGEGVPRDYVTGETIDRSFELLRQTDWEGQLRPVSDFAGGVRLARDFTLAGAAGDQRGCIGNAARCAVELALLDAFGRRFNTPISQAAAAPEFAAIYQPRRKCRYSGVLTSASPRKELVRAVKCRLFGFKQCKIKVGTQGQDDVARMRRFRKILGAGRDLRIDANEAWTPAEAVERIHALEQFNVTAVEQPVPHNQVAGLTDVRGRVRTPIMLDESLCNVSDAEAAIRSGWCDIFNLRLSKCGGFLRSLELAALAQQSGIVCQLGCQVGESGVLSAAGRQFACAVGGLRYCEGSYERFLVRERLTKEDLTFRWRGFASNLTGGGLGVTMDLDRLDRATQSRERLYGGDDGGAS